jgi:hypothetical protein
MGNLNRVLPGAVARTCLSRLIRGRQIVTGLKDQDDAVIKSAPCDTYTLFISHRLALMRDTPHLIKSEMPLYDRFIPFAIAPFETLEPGHANHHRPDRRDYPGAGRA